MKVLETTHGLRMGVVLQLEDPIRESAWSSNL